MKFFGDLICISFAYHPRLIPRSLRPIPRPLRSILRNCSELPRSERSERSVGAVRSVTTPLNTHKNTNSYLISYLYLVTAVGHRLTLVAPDPLLSCWVPLQPGALVSSPSSAARKKTPNRNTSNKAYTT